jgi:DNA-nicking Smr family endonuclease
MTRSGGKSRRLSEGERGLWREVTRSIAPLRRHSAGAIDAEKEPEPPAAPKAAAPRAAKPAAKPNLKAPPAPAPLGRKEKAKVARGRTRIERRLDLHGHTQSEAHAALLRFLHKAGDDGARLVLVITGRSGVLKRQVPLWLALPEFRALVVGFEEAHQRHGGEGALYLRLRKGR